MTTTVLGNVQGKPVERNGIVESAVVLTNVIGTTPAIDMRRWAFGQLHIAAGATSQDVAVYTCDTEAGTYLPLYDSSGTAVTISVVASRAYELSTAICGCAFIKFLQATSSDATPVAIVLKG